MNPLFNHPGILRYTKKSDIIGFRIYAKGNSNPIYTHQIDVSKNFEEGYQTHQSVFFFFQIIFNIFFFFFLIFFFLIFFLNLIFMLIYFLNFLTE